MFYFYADLNFRLPEKKKGIALKTKQLFPDLSSAVALRPRRILVVDTDALPATPTGTKTSETSLYETLAKKKKTSVTVPLDSIRNLFPYRRPMEIAAGGGIITRMKKGKLQVLLIYRRGVWDLPKGKQDPGESIRKCARREVKEELGISNAKIVKPLDVTVHVYSEHRRLKVKTTHWYQMTTTDTKFTPEKREGIKKVEWHDWKKAEKAVGYKTLRKLLQRTRLLIDLPTD